MKKRIWFKWDGKKKERKNWLNNQGERDKKKRMEFESLQIRKKKLLNLKRQRKRKLEDEVTVGNSNKSDNSHFIIFANYEPGLCSTRDG